MKLNKPSKFIAVILTLVMVIGLMPQFSLSASAISDSWDGTSDTSWYNDTDTSFTISTAKQLAGLAALVNAGTDDFSEKTITLGADIQLNDTTGWESWSTTSPARTWTPIGDTTYPFNGRFDGAAHKVIGIYINNTAIYPVGLFGYAEGGSTIENVGVTSSYIQGGAYVGGIIGSITGSGATVSNCYNEGMVIGTQYVGGIAGMISFSAQLVNCYNLGAVSCGGVASGGIAGESIGSTIINCYNSGSVDSTGDDAGGIVGYHYSSAKVMNCYNVGSISSTGNNIGGVIGYNKQTGCTVKNCYNTGSVGGGSEVGGIIGLNEDYNVVRYCYWLIGTDAVGASSAAISYSYSFSGSGTAWTLADDAEYTIVPASGSASVTVSINASLLDALNTWADTSDYNSWKADSALTNSGYPFYAEALTGTASISGNAVYGETLTASLTGSNNSGTLSYQWIRTNWSGDAVIASATGNTYTLTADDLYYTISVKIASSEQGGRVTSTATSSVQRAACETTDITAPVTSEVTASSITLTALDGYQYVCVPAGQTSLSDWWQSSNVFSGLSSNTAYDIYQRVKATSTHNASANSEKLTVTTGLSDNWVDYVSEPALDGTTYTITSAEELAWIAKQAQDGNRFIDYTFELTSDIDLSAHFWVPIGDESTGICATFNGNEHTISNMKIDSSEYPMAGLFGNSFVSITGVKLDTVSITGNPYDTSYVGALCAVNAGNISNCSVTQCSIQVSSLYNILAGGLCGVAYDTGNIYDCNVSDCTIIVNGLGDEDCYTGILCGYSTCILVNCYAEGSVSGSSTRTFFGGLVGYFDSNEIYNCGANGTVIINDNVSQSCAGGLVGRTEGASIYNSYANVAVTGDDGSYTGGLVGYANGGQLRNCAAYGAASVSAADSTPFWGGLLGYNPTVEDEDEACTLSDCYWNISATQSYGGSARATGEIIGIGNNTPEVDAADTTCMGITSADLKTKTRLDALNGYADTANAGGMLSYTLRTWILNTPDGYPGFVEASVNPPVPPTDSGDNSFGAIGTGVTNSNGTNVIVNGQYQNAGIAETTTENGQTKTTITVDTDKLDVMLDSAGDGAIVTIPIADGADIASGELTGQMVKNMEDKDATLIVQTDSATYTLPATEINIEAVSQQLGTNVSLADINVTVSISTPSDSMVQVIENAGDDSGFTLMVPAVAYTITCTYGDQTVNVSSFNAYVERTIAIPDGVDHTKITTAVVVEPDGTVRHVPTEIVEIDGAYYAVINSLTNSVYTLIHNDVEFADVEGHWAKDAIDNMASRTIINGDGNGNFRPDRNITRAEFAAIVVRALGLAEGMGENKFRDVSSQDWYCGYVETAITYGIISGYEDNTFRPNVQITREQAMTIIARAMKITKLNTELYDSDITTLLDNYTDAVDISNYARENAAACVKAGIISGKGNETLAPTDNMTRAEVSVIVQRLLQKSGLI